MARHGGNLTGVKNVTGDGTGDLTGFNSFTATNVRIDEIQEGVAMALALQAPFVPESKDYVLSGRFRNFKGYTALGVSAGVHLGDMVQLD
ncbi:MAG: hypothetical protein ACR2OR_06040, partial [Hyphomicrobiales bacterium]